MIIDRLHTTAVGDDVLNGNGVALALISNRNSYFSRERIAQMTTEFQQKGIKIVFVLPDEPERANYEAFGYDPKKAEKKSREAFNQIANNTRRIIAAVVPGIDMPVLRWADFRENPAYIHTHEWISNLYDKNVAFKKAVDETTDEVLKSKSEKREGGQYDLAKGIPFILKEYAFLLASADILNSDAAACLYHRPMPLFKDLLMKKYGQYPTKKDIGMITVEVDEIESE